MAIGGWRTEMEVWTCLMVVDVPAKTWHCFAEAWCYVPLHCIIVSASFLPNPVASCPSFPSIINIPEFLVQWSGSLELYIVIHSYTKQISHKKKHTCKKHISSKYTWLAEFPADINNTLQSSQWLDWLPFINLPFKMAHQSSSKLHPHFWSSQFQSHSPGFRCSNGWRIRRAFKIWSCVALPFA